MFHSSKVYCSRRFISEKAIIVARSITASFGGTMSFSVSSTTGATLHVGERHTDHGTDRELRACGKQRVTSYSPPEWAKDLRGLPTARIELSHKNTPIQKWYLPGIPSNFEVYIKRDDLTGCSLSGNKARKLEFLLAEALVKDHDTLITCGSTNSNFCRALTSAGRELGFGCHLLLRSSSMELEDFQMEGNSAMNQLLGASIYMIPKTASFQTAILPRMETLADHLRTHSKKSPYLVPIGGTSHTGVFGHIECYNELKEQGALDEFTDLVITTGSGGSIAGFSIGNHLNGGKMKMHGMAVCDDAAFFHGEANTLLKSVGLQDGGGQRSVTSEELITIVEGVKGRGYGLSTEEELDFILETAATTGIFLDPTYTGKAAFHMVKRIQTAPESFRGKKILFYNSGSVLGLLDGRMKDLLRSRRTYHSIYDWSTMDHFPLSSSDG